MIDRTVTRSGLCFARQRTALARAMFAASVSVLLAGCLTRGGDIPYDPKDFPAPDLTKTAIEAYDLPLGPLDVVKVSVFRVPDLSGEFQIDAKGNIDLPLLGILSARDQRPEEFANALERMYGERYINNPQISIRVLASNQTAITVEGGVNAPGVYPLAGRATLLSAIAMARGFSTNDANPKRVAIFRKQGGKTLAAAFDVTAIRHGKMNDPEVYPGDIVAVDSSQLRMLYRDLIQTLPAISIFNSL